MHDQSFKLALDGANETFMIYLHKILPIIASPLGLVIALLLLTCLTRKIRFTLLAIATLYVCSLPILSNTLLGQLEKDYQLSDISAAPDVSTIVVLSGMVSPVAYGDDIRYEFTEAVDRILAGIQLIKAQKSNRLILTRGQLPWSKGAPEGDFLAKFAEDYGVPPEVIDLTINVQNTDDEAKAVASMLGDDRHIILVTSAFHMPRARLVFENQNIDVTPFPVDFRKGSGHIDILDFLPQSWAFDDSSLYVREMIGRLYYSIKY